MKRDIHGREIKAGDILKIYHFTAARRRKIFMYKLVVECDEFLNICTGGQYLYCVDVPDIAKTQSLPAAHKCALHVIGDCEIIDGGTVTNNDLFWERKRVKT